MTIALYSVIFGLIIIIFTQTLLHRIERKDLYDRIMCKDINDYKNIGSPMRKSMSGHERVLKKWRGEEE